VNKLITWRKKMPKPADGSAVTQDQIDKAVNIAHFPKPVVPDIRTKWHEGQWESWANGTVYNGGTQVGTGINQSSVHIYWLEHSDQFILLRPNEKPGDYGVK
jgi:hypothetical protein